MGYEDIYGNKYDMMDCVDVPNGSEQGGKWRYLYPDGTYRFVKGVESGGWISGIVNGLNMDMVPTAVSGSSTTCYCDYYSYSSSTSRVVYRGYSNAYANGGVSNASANIDASSSNANIGSRLAFRGKIVKAESVVAFKAVSEVS